MRRLACFAFALLALAAADRVRVEEFAVPVDALSAGFASAEGAVLLRGHDGTGWTAWQELRVENEQDPALLESNLVVFDRPVMRVQMKGAPAELHPIRVARDPVHATVAATVAMGIPKILTREEWGADEKLLYRTSPAQGDSSGEKGENGGGSGEPSNRIKDCDAAQRDYPEEFRVARTEALGPDGQTYRWAQQYSPEVRMLVVHHTAMAVGPDSRTPVERVRALYEYHANNRGWGDIGYHYVIDEEGQIYEGKSGGDYVVGGHAYCHNVGTVGVALLGNFDLELPSQTQMRSLQWLLDELADRYEIALDRKIRFHGKSLPTVVGHRDLVSTDCPGYYAYGVLAQVRDHLESGLLAADVIFPKIVAAKEKIQKTAETRRQERLARVPGGRSTGVIDRRLAIKLQSQPVTALRRTLRNRVKSAGGTPRPGTPASARVALAPRASSRMSSRGSVTDASGAQIRIRLKSQEGAAESCDAVDLDLLAEAYRGTVTCVMVDGKPAIINTLSLEDYLLGLSEEPDTEPFEKQRAFAIAARTYAAYYMDPAHRKFPGMPYDGSDSPAEFQAYGGRRFEDANADWREAVAATAGKVLTVDGVVIRAPYFSRDDGRTRSPAEAGWKDFPHAEIFVSKPDPWCEGMTMAGHGVGMSGCGAEAQAEEGKAAEEILVYYYPGTAITKLP